uniref:acid phosphatase n=1 Tax=Parastrongyloides trichosuri TaxID=131310 RepID=A0A0N4ZDZ3_PARTI
MLSPKVSQNKLVMAQILWRHGERSPVGTYPNDIYNETDWEVPYGLLTCRGKQQHVSLGKYLRNRYMKKYKLLTDNYNPNEIEVRSTNVNRTIESAKANLRGFYNRQDIDNIPILTEYFGYGDEWAFARSCKRYSNLFKKRLEELSIFYKEPFSNFTQQLEEHTGIKNIKPINLTLLYDNLKLQKASKKQLPSWVDDNLLSELKEISFKILQYIIGVSGYNKTESDEMIKYSGGILLKYMMDQFVNKINGSNNKKYIIYSAHDVTVSLLIRMLKDKLYFKRSDLEPGFAAAIVLELYKSFDGRYSLKVLYRKNYKSQFENITNEIRGCHNRRRCNFYNFYHYMKSKVPINVKEECSE